MLNKKTKRTRILTNFCSSFIATVLVSGCAQFQSSATPEENDLAVGTLVQPLEPEIIEGDFEPETLYALMSAEIAGQRNRFDVTLLNYVQQAKATRDLGVIKRAIQIAQFLKSQNALIQLSNLWLELDENALEPYQILAFQHTRKGEFESAIAQMEKIYQLGGNADFESLAILAKKLPEEDQVKLETLYQQLTAKYPENFEMGYGYALILRTREKHSEALNTIDSYLKKDPEFRPGILLQSTLLYDTGKMHQALDVLAKASRDYPEDRKLGTLYARMLVDDGQLARSEEEYNKLLKRFPDVPGLKLAHALVALEIGKTDIATRELQELIESGQHVNESHYYIARTADQKGNFPEAIKHYQQVTSGTHYFSALAREIHLRAINGELDKVRSELAEERMESPSQAAAIWQVEINLLIDLNMMEEAFQTVSLALEDEPGNLNLVYARAMIFERMEKLTEMEQDLRTIITKDPQNAIALNALGYTLADKTDRYLEAFELITRALQLNPDSPAVMDSLGWVYFKMGDTNQALQHIEQAYGRFPDPEVAAHYGEILWSIGKKAEAKKVWSKAIKESPDHRILTDTLKRLDIKL